MNDIRVIVVDDSFLMRRIISDMLNEADGITVVATAKDGNELLYLLEKEKIDVITLDVEMPGMNGIEVLKVLKERKINTPVIVLSGLSKDSTELTLGSLEEGAFDFIPKPSGEISLDIIRLKNQLIEIIYNAYNRKKAKVNNVQQNPMNHSALNRKISLPKAITMAASTGGPKAYGYIFSELNFYIDIPILIVQHMPKGFTKTFAERLNKLSPMVIKEGEQGELIRGGTVYVAPGGYHMEVIDGHIYLNEAPPLWGVRPAADRLIKSAAEFYKDGLISIVLTGMGKDGAEGIKVTKAFGGYTISEAESSSTIYGMSKAAYETGCVDEVLSLYSIPKRIEKLLGGGVYGSNRI
ncbi:MAG: chemotaxis-specific protein-glutamate methyltransferase CheB [Clostridiaceae bacterium]